MDYKKFIELIEKYDSIIIFRHVQPDGDAYGSSFGLKELIKTNYPNKKVYCVGEKASDYELFFGSLDIVKEEIAKESLGITLDVPNLERIDGADLFKITKEKIKIDHHIFVESFASLEWVETSMGSTCEMITTIAKNINWKISEKSATFLYFGITTDCNRFLYCYTPNLFECSKLLIENKADVVSIYPFIYEGEVEDTRFRGICQAFFEVTPNGVGYNKLTPEVLAKYNIPLNKASGMVNALANMKGIDIWAHFSENEDGTVRAELRSKGLPVNTIANEFGGGGHKQAAGCTLMNWDEVDICIEKLDNLIYVNKEYHEELEFGLEIIENASKIVKEIYDANNLEIKIKKDDSPVTQADLKCEAYLREQISKKYPDFGILSEETDDNFDRLNKDFCWIIDPVDGTEDFIKHDDEFAINLALSCKGEIVVGLIAAPAKNSIYFASKNGGSFVKRNGKIERIFASKKLDHLIACSSRFHSDDKDRKYFEQYSNLFEKVVGCGSSYKHCLIAEGVYDFAIKTGEGVKEWDVAPVDIILREAGASFTTAKGDKFVFNKKDVYAHDGYCSMNKFNKGLLIKN